jgi:hypothetical protein
MSKAFNSSRVRVFQIWTEVSKNYSNCSVIDGYVVADEESKSLYINHLLYYRNDSLSNILATMGALYTLYISE